ncbi:MAG: hypothetical protein ACO3LE_09825 [Bdellovibrionota bacterium]
MALETFADLSDKNRPLISAKASLFRDLATSTSGLKVAVLRRIEVRDMRKLNLNIFLLSLIFGLFLAEASFAKTRCADIFARIQTYELLGENEWVALLKTAQKSKSLPVRAFETLDRLRNSDVLAKARPFWKRILSIGPTPFQKFLDDTGLSEKYWSEFKRRNRVLEKTKNEIFDFIGARKNQETILIMEFLLQDSKDAPKKSIYSILKDQYSPTLRQLFQTTMKNTQPEFRAHAVKAFAEYFRTTEKQMKDFLKGY